MAELFAPTLEDQIACVARELVLREKVYPGWIERGRMSRAKAERELEAMRAVLATLRGLEGRK